MSLPTQQKLNDHLVRWNQAVGDYHQALVEFGEAKSDHEHARAVFMVKTRHRDPSLSVSVLGMLCDADDGIFAANQRYRHAEAEVAGLRSRLDWCRAFAEGLRSEISTERAEAGLYSSDRSTP